MSRLVVVSNRVASVHEGEATTGGLAAGVLDALKRKGGQWFGWSGEVAHPGQSSPERPNPERPDLKQAVQERKVGPITFFTVDLSRQDYDEFYGGFSNGALAGAALPKRPWTF